MNKALIIIIALVVLVPIGYYLLSPLWIVVEADEASPLAAAPVAPSAPSQVVVQDALDDMDEDTRAAFDQAVEEMAKETTVMEDDMPTGPQLVSSGAFKPRAHSVAGNALLIESDGQKVLRFEDFETDNGPQLHIYLSRDLGDDDFVDLGGIKATKGNVNYDIPADVDTSVYNKVLVWCKPFGVLFSYADISQ